MHVCTNKVHLLVPCVSSSKLWDLRPYHTSMEREKKWGQGGAEILSLLPSPVECGKLGVSDKSPEKWSRNKRGNRHSSECLPPMGSLPRSSNWLPCQVGMLLHVLFAPLSPLPLTLQGRAKEGELSWVKWVGKCSVLAYRWHGQVSLPDSS